MLIYRPVFYALVAIALNPVYLYRYGLGGISPKALMYALVVIALTHVYLCSPGGISPKALLSTGTLSATAYYHYHGAGAYRLTIMAQAA